MKNCNESDPRLAQPATFRPTRSLRAQLIPYFRACVPSRFVARCGLRRLTAASLLGLILVAGPAAAQTLSVTKTADTNDGTCDADCSLREAILAANAIPGNAYIELPAGTYALTLTGIDENAGATGDLDITSFIEIQGAGAGTTVIDGAGADRVFEVHAGAAHVYGLTIRNGALRFGAAMRVHIDAVATLSDCLITENLETPISSIGSVLIQRCSITGNTATEGGGIDNLGQMDIVESEISGNVTPNRAGGISHRSVGSQIPSILTLFSSTVSGNTADTYGGGIYLLNHIPQDPPPILYLYNSAVVGNYALVAGGGIYHYSGVVEARNSIVAGNTTSGSGPDCNGPFTSLGHNLIQSTAACAISGDLTGNILGVPAKLGPLQNLGGITRAHLPLPGSPVLDAGDDATCESADQRSVDRPQGAHCDIGAVERLFESVATTFPPGGGTLSTDLDATGAFDGDPLETTLFSPLEGAASISESERAGTSAAGFSLFGYVIGVVAPTASATVPLRLSIELFSYHLPAGVGPEEVEIFRDGVRVDPCAGAPGSADPDPCVAVRELDGEGDLHVTVLTSHASQWTLGVAAVCPAVPSPTCRAAQKSLLVVKRKDGATKSLVWKWLKGEAVEESELADPTDADAYALCLYDASDRLVADLTVPPNLAKWSAVTGQGFKYGDDDATADGAKKIILKSGAAGRAKAIVKGLGANLPDPALDTLDLPLTVQLIKDGGAPCLGATYDAGDVIKQDAGQLKVKR